MPILNYTTEISVERTLTEIHRMLAKAKARTIATQYGDEGEPVGVGFRIKTVYGERPFMLPVQPDPVQAVLVRQYRSKLGVEMKQTTAEHARRVAWRIVKDWLEAQLALVETEMVTFDQVMLPYMQANNGQLLYDAFKEHQLSLPSPAE